MHFGMRYVACLCVTAWHLVVMIEDASALGSGNLLSNGDFSNPDDPLAGWMYDYSWTEHKRYSDNHTRVEVIPKQGTKRNVLKFTISQDIAAGMGYGVKVDSEPVPYEQGARYKLSASAKTTGPNCRIYITGYRWKPGVKPHDKPTLRDLRRTFKQGAGEMVYFKGKRDGALANPTKSWSRGSSSSFSPNNLSELGQKHLKRSHFLVVHIIGILGQGGELYVDDVELKKISR
jgi:hypothetical protein